MKGDDMTAEDIDIKYSEPGIYEVTIKGEASSGMAVVKFSGYKYFGYTIVATVIFTFGYVLATILMFG